jgi:hypothetical protein
VRSRDFTDIDKGDLMRRHFLTHLMIGAALAGSASLIAVAAPAGVAGAATLTSSCTTLTGVTTATATKSTEKLSGCSGTASALTGKTGTVAVTTNMKTKSGTATVTWATKKTSIESYKYSELLGSKNKCANKSGYTKLAEAVETGKVTGGTATAMKNGVVTSNACAYSKSGKVYIFNLGPVKS